MVDMHHTSGKASFRLMRVPSSFGRAAAAVMAVIFLVAGVTCGVLAARATSQSNLSPTDWWQPDLSVARTVAEATAMQQQATPVMVMVGMAAFSLLNAFWFAGVCYLGSRIVALERALQASKAG